MSSDRKLIAPFNSGLVSGQTPWLTPEDAFEKLNNAYIFRGKIKKRFGSSYTGADCTDLNAAQLYSRLAISLGNTDGNGDIDQAASALPAGTVYAIGNCFSIDEYIYTVVEAGTPGTMIRNDGVVDTCTFDTTNGNYTIHGAAATKPVYFYQAQPVMGLGLYEAGPANDHTAFAFDTRFVYKFSGGKWLKENIGGLAALTSTATDFVYMANFAGQNPEDVSMFTTNFKVSDDMWVYSGAAWAQFQPLFTAAGHYIKTAKLIIPFKGRLLLLNTGENTGAYESHPNRVRYSIAGAALPNNTAFLQPNEAGYAGAGFIDADTEEEIVSCGFVKDRLIVFFERSTFELAYTGNPIQPFTWQRLNSEYGSEGAFSTVSYAGGLITISSQGIAQCNGLNVNRIDAKIPDEVHQFTSETSAIKKIHGIRDYYSELVYWSFPTAVNDNVNNFPDKVLVYNYDNNSWSFNDDCFTCWGYFEQTDDLTWEKLGMTWDEADFTWDSGRISADIRKVIAGNQQGYVLEIDRDKTTNASAMQVTNVTYDPVTDLSTFIVINHNLLVGEYVKVSTLGNIDFPLEIARVEEVTDANTFTADFDLGVGVYTGGGTLQRVSNIEIKTKLFNPYLNKGYNVSIPQVDFIFQRTEYGEITVDYSVSSADVSMIDEGGPDGTNALLGDCVLDMCPFDTVEWERYQKRLRHTVYFQARGEFVQFFMYWTDDQMLDKDISFSPFVLEGFILYTQRIGRI